MTPVLANFDLILDSFPVGASHALSYAVQAMSSYHYKPKRISHLHCSKHSSHMLIIQGCDLGFVKSTERYVDLANNLSKTS